MYGRDDGGDVPDESDRDGGIRRGSTECLEVGTVVVHGDPIERVADVLKDRLESLGRAEEVSELLIGKVRKRASGELAWAEDLGELESGSLIATRGLLGHFAFSF